MAFGNRLINAGGGGAFADGQVIAVNTSSGEFRSTDFGATFTQVNSLNLSNISIGLGSQYSVCKNNISTDFGATYTSLSSGTNWTKISGDGSTIYAYNTFASRVRRADSFSTNFGDIIYRSPYYQSWGADALHISYNGGDVWWAGDPGWIQFGANFSAPLDIKQVGREALYVSDDKTKYISTYSSSVFYSTNNYSTSTQIHSNLYGYKAADYSGDGTVLYLGSAGTGSNRYFGKLLIPSGTFSIIEVAVNAFSIIKTNTTGQHVVYADGSNLRVSNDYGVTFTTKSFPSTIQGADVLRVQ